jgi:protein-S-isoprenylcysteine O-methyltransferase Ste14
MFALYLGLLGPLAFVFGVGLLGLRLRRFPSKENAETYSRIAHFLFFAGLGAPGVIWLFYPGFTHLDELVGLPPLPLKPFFLIIGVLIELSGLYLLGITNRALRDLGGGANAFLLTKRIVEKDIYQYSRNPMSLGYYLFSLGIGLISGSTLLTLGVLFGLVPAHIFFLKYFEELEIELRFGESYKEYKHRTPFLVPRFWQGE